MSVDVIAAALEVAAASTTQSLLGGGTLYCCAVGCDRSLAQFVADRLMYPVDVERPALPALALTCVSSTAPEPAPWPGRAIRYCVSTPARTVRHCSTESPRWPGATCSSWV